jgi:hypothetical protein
MNADLLCGSLAEPSRLRTYSAVVLGARTPEQIAGVTGLDNAAIHKVDAGLLTRTNNIYQRPA